MFNLTILSLSMHSLYTISPLIIGHQNIIQKINLDHIIAYSIFYNPKEFKIAKGSFKHDIGSFVLYENGDFISNNTFLYKNEFFNSSYKPKENDITGKLLIIADCFFDEIIGTEYQYYIELSNKITFYMIRCIFNKCDFKNCGLYLYTRSTTLSHICCSELKSTTYNKNGIFLAYHSSEESFIKLIYSTIFGTNEEINSYSVFYVDQICPIKFQCNNFSHFKFRKENSDCSLVNILTSKSLTMLMNTFYNSTSGQIIRVNPNKASNDYKYLIGTTNFVNNVYGVCLVSIKMLSESKICFNNCVFANNISFCSKKIIDKNGESEVLFINCIFNREINTFSNLKTVQCIIDNDPKSHTLAHYAIKNICDGSNITSNVGCKNNTCPDMGCNDDEFEFKSGDVPYDDNFDFIPSLTSIFSESNFFSFSEYFSFSKSFSFSQMFSCSFQFSKSNIFSFSNKFNDSDLFSKSNVFRFSAFFSNSLNFNSTFLFSCSSKFTQTFFFSKSDNFVKTNNFTKSNDSFIFTYNSSCKQSKSNNYSRSNEYSCSSQLTNFFASNIFSKTQIMSPKSLIIIPIKNKTQKESSKSKIYIGVAVSITVLVAIIFILIYVYFSKMKSKKSNDFDDETIEIIEDTENISIIQNPIFNFLDEDDPFEKEFE